MNLQILTSPQEVLNPTFLVSFNKLKFEPAQIIVPDGTGRVRELLQDATGETLGLSVGETASLKHRQKNKKKKRQFYFLGL